MSKLTADWRTKFFEMDFPLLPDVNHEQLERFRLSDKKSQVGQKPPQIVLCYHQEKRRFVDFFAKRISAYISNPVIERPRDSAEGKSVIDKADIVVLFVSSAFVQTPILVEEANVALCRQRWSDSMILLPVFLDSLPSNPAYFNLFLTLFSITDSIWENKKPSLLTRISWRCTLNSRQAGFLDAAALFAGFIVTNSTAFKGSFKTLLSLQELSKSVKEMSRQIDEEPPPLCNPMVFEECKPTFVTSHSVEDQNEADESSKAGSHRPTEADN